LHGIRVLEISHMLAGPYCGMLLADLGAEVIKIEFGEGDIARRTGERHVNGCNVYFASLNRNKKSIALDLTEQADRERFHTLVAGANGLITNLRPAAIKKLGLTYEALRSHNSAIACLALTGFGLDGPYSDLPAYDYIIQAMTGLMLMTGAPDGPPVRVGYSIVDNTGGMMAAIGLLAKLLEGRGGQVDVALYDTMLSQLNYVAAEYLNGGEQPARHPLGGHPFFVPAQIFPTTDGYIAIFITHEKFWRSFAAALAQPAWLEDPRFASMRARRENRELVIASVAAVVHRKSSAELLDLLQPLGLVTAAVGTLADALRDPHTAARRMITSIATPAGPLHLIANPIKIPGFEESYDPPPALGEHTAACLEPQAEARVMERR
jgi:crotonobetainyl-CoA:carnitine CoA-transferase CaiB-like acyl-CoA transferase